MTDNPSAADAEHGRLFLFEEDFVRSLRCIPMCVRFKLDRTAIKLSLRQWSRFSVADREQLRVTPCDFGEGAQAYRAALIDLVRVRTGDEAATLAEDLEEVWLEAAPPRQIVALCTARGVAVPSPKQWTALAELERYALFKLTRDRHENHNFVPAMKEFGLIE